ncbi:MAG: DUF4157 domain-containing protein [Limnohabitans sp.]|nr:DUF4157 domain-containing protein [Limnohabitans sp.]
MRAFDKKKQENIHSSNNFFSPKIQKKLKTGTVGDKYEVEADRVADQVVNKTSNGSNGLFQSKAEEDIQQKPIAETISTVQKQEMKEEEPVQKKSDKEEDKLQKKEMKEDDKVQKKENKEEEPVQKKSDKEEDKIQKKSEEKEEPVQAKCDDCEKEDKVQKKQEDEKEKPVQAKSNNAQSEVQNNQLENQLDNSKGSGSGLDNKTKREMESGFGADFSNVKIHTDSNAVQMSQELGAQAFTNGNDVYFNKGKYNPESKEGKHLLAHELTHTIQQTGMVQKSIEPNVSSSENLESPRFQGEYRLEQAYDDLDYITVGAKGEPVAKIQSGLMDLGYELPKFGVDGDFGNETKKAVLDFQNDYDLAYDGIVGQETMGKLDSIYAGGKLNTNCCGEASQLPQNNLEFDIDSDTMTATFCSKGSFNISSTANWVTPHKAKHYHIFITAIQGGTIRKPNRRFNVGFESQSFKVKTDDCIFFKVIIQVIDPVNSPNLKGKFSVTN